MAVSDTLITRYVLTDSYSPKAKQVERATKQVADAMDHAGRRSANLGSVLAGLGRGALGVFQGLATAAGAGAVAVLGLAGVAVKASADMDSLKRALVAVAGSTTEAEKQFARLKEVAKSPGLGLREAIQGSVRLQAAGFSALLAERALRAFGNAIAMVGGGKSELDGVTMALSQIASKGKISAEEILQLAERIPQIRKAMQAAFGTSDTEALQKMGIEATEFVTRVTAELEKLPSVTGGARNAFENLGDVMFQALAQAGDVLNKWLIPAIETVGAWLNWMVSSGLITKIVEGFTGLFGLGGGGQTEPLVKALAFVTALMEELPRLTRDAGNYMVRVFNHIGHGIAEMFKVAFALFIGGQIFVWLRAVVAAYQTWRAAVTGVAIAQMVVNALSGIGWIAIAGAVAAAAGTYFALTEMFKSLDGNLKEIGDAPALDGVHRKAKEYEEMFKSSLGTTTGTLPGAAGVTTPTPGAAGSAMPSERSPASALQTIARATSETAKNTRETVDLQRFALGSGNRGDLGVDPITLRRMRGGSQPLEVNVTGADESINRILSELLRAVLPVAVRQSRT